MIKESLAHPAHPVPEGTGDLEHVSTVVPRALEPVPEYVWRGRGLFETYRDELLEGYQGGGKWLVPSGTDSDRHYEVRVGVRRQSCECQGYARHDHCSHLVAAQRVARRSAVCDCCGERRWWSELVEVQENDALFAWFPGDRLCDGCRPRHWA